MEDILDQLVGEDLSQIRFEEADKGKRLLTFVIDVIGYFIASIIVGLLLGVFMVASGREDFLSEEPSTISTLFDYLSGIIIITSYYTLQEYFLKGKTLGKFITGTRAVTVDNRPMDLTTTLIRSLSRVIPFEPFSFLGASDRGWHDRLSKTKVIIDRGWRE